MGISPHPRKPTLWPFDPPTQARYHARVQVNLSKALANYLADQRTYEGERIDSVIRRLLGLRQEVGINLVKPLYVGNQIIVPVEEHKRARFEARVTAYARRNRRAYSFSHTGSQLIVTRIA